MTWYEAVVLGAALMVVGPVLAAVVALVVQLVRAVLR